MTNSTISAILDKSIMAVISLGHSIIVILCFLFDLNVTVPNISSTLCFVNCFINDLMIDVFPDVDEPCTTTTKGGYSSTSSSGFRYYA